MSAFPEDYSRKRLPSARDFLIARSVFERNMHEMEMNALLRDIHSLKHKRHDPKYVCSFIKVPDDLLSVEKICPEVVNIPVRYSECKRIAKNCGGIVERTFKYEKIEDESVYRYIEDLGVNFDELHEIAVRYHDNGVLPRRTKRARTYIGERGIDYEPVSPPKHTIVNLTLYVYHPEGAIPPPSKKGFVYVYIGDNDSPEDRGIYEMIVREDGVVEAQQTNDPSHPPPFIVDIDDVWYGAEYYPGWENQMLLIKKIPIFGPQNKPDDE